MSSDLSFFDGEGFVWLSACSLISEPTLELIELPTFFTDYCKRSTFLVGLLDGDLYGPPPTYSILSLECFETLPLRSSSDLVPTVDSGIGYFVFSEPSKYRYLSYMICYMPVIIPCVEAPPPG